MNRHEWKKISVAFTAMFVSLIGTLTLISFFGPKPGAPEGERTLEIGPVWISRIQESVTGNTHHWWTEVNWSVLLSIVVVAGVIGLLCVRPQEGETA